MRILLVHNKYKQYGGEDSVFYSETEILKKNGHDVQHLVFDNKEIQSFYDKILTGLRSIYNRKSAKILKELIHDFHPEIIHVHNFFPLASPSIFFVAKEYNVPVIMTLHNYRLICPSATLFYQNEIYEKSINSIIPMDAIMKGVYRNSKIQTASVVAVSAIHTLLGTWKTKVDQYIALTQFSRNKYIESALKIPKEKFVIKPHSVNDYGDGLEERENFFLFVARLSEEKGLDTLLEASRILSFNLTIIGDGPMRKHVEDFTEKFPNVRYVGFQQKPEIMNYMKSCKALIFSSKNYESLGLTILEAFSSGTPVIASGHGAASEIVSDGINGLHFKPGDHGDLAEKINILSENKDLAKKLSVQARKTYLELYTPEKNYSQLIAIYENLINERQSKTVRPLVKVA